MDCQRGMKCGRSLEGLRIDLRHISIRPDTRRRRGTAPGRNDRRSRRRRRSRSPDHRESSRPPGGVCKRYRSRTEGRFHNVREARRTSAGCRHRSALTDTCRCPNRGRHDSRPRNSPLLRSRRLRHIRDRRRTRRRRPLRTGTKVNARIRPRHRCFRGRPGVRLAHSRRWSGRSRQRPVALRHRTL